MANRAVFSGPLALTGLLAACSTAPTPAHDAASSCDGCDAERVADVVFDAAPPADAPLVSDATEPHDSAPACDPGPYGHGSWPPACWRPFAATSPFNVPVPANPRLMASSAAIIAHDPTYTLHCTGFGGGCVTDGMTVHAPAGAVAQGGPSSGDGEDRHMTIMDQASGWEYDLWHVQTRVLPAGGGTLLFDWGGHTRLDGDGVSVGTGEGTASHFGNQTRRIRAEEMAAGRIDHALAMVVNCDNHTFVYPALASDQRCSAVGLSETDAPPMGARFWLEMTADAIDALPAPAWKKTVLHAMAEYGMFLGDTGSSFYFDLQTESGVQYTRAGGTDRWLAFALANGWTPYMPDANYVGSWHAHDDGIDWDAAVWSHLRVLDPCVSRGDCR